MVSKPCESGDFKNCTPEQLNNLYKLLSSKLETIKRKKTEQKYPLLKDYLCGDAIKELQNFTTITYEDTVEEFKNEIKQILNQKKQELS